MPILEENERRIRDAMEFLFDEWRIGPGPPLTIATLARTAGVSRSTVQRSPDLVQEFRARSFEVKASRPVTSALNDRAQLAKAKRRFRDLEAELEKEIDELAQKIQVLTLENARLQERLQELGDNVVRIR